jgi:alcohol dehydrogenase, propanol-preferring
MRAMVLHAPCPVEYGPLKNEDMAIPEPQKGEILIKVLACGVCHTDLHTVEGDLELPLLPLIPGHQVVGRVDGLGPDSTRHKPGDRVGVTWFHSSCGSCRYCRHDRENLCDNARFTGYHAHGGYAEYMVVPEASAFHIPEFFSDEQAVPLLCGGVIGYRALRLSEAESGCRLGLFGFGNSAHVVIQIAVHRGMKPYVFTRGAHHGKLALELGALWAGKAEDTPPEPLDSAIVFAPAGRLVHDALRVLGKGGTLALAGITMTPIPEMDYKLIYGERTVRSTANTTRRDAVELLAAAAKAQVRTVVETFPMEEANAALKKMKCGALEAGAALLI